jgi:hypothetical protein
MKAGWYAALCAALAGCGAIQPARMVQPAGIESRTVAVSIDGMGGGTRGSFTLAGNAGSFTRSASRLELFDELVAYDKGASSFTVRGADFPEPVTARCGFRQTTSTIGVVQFTPSRFSYECSYDGLPGARFVLQAPRSGGVETLQAPRRGEFTAPGRALAVRSVHEAVGGAVPLAAPLGYIVDSAGATVATVELNGMKPALRLPAANADAGIRRDVMLVALSLALLWDPAGH